MYRIKNLLFICRIHSDHCPSVINVHLFIHSTNDFSSTAYVSSNVRPWGQNDKQPVTNSALMELTAKWRRQSIQITQLYEYTLTLGL